MNENSELKVFKNIVFFGELFNNQPNDLLETNSYKTFKSFYYHC